MTGNPKSESEKGRKSPRQFSSPPPCLRCAVEMHPVTLSDWVSNPILSKELKHIASSLGIRLYHCPQCGRVEVFR